MPHADFCLVRDRNRSIPLVGWCDASYRFLSRTRQESVGPSDGMVRCPMPIFVSYETGIGRSLWWDGAMPHTDFCLVRDRNRSVPLAGWCDAPCRFLSRTRQESVG